MEEKQITSKRCPIETKKKIYESAKWLFSEYGFENVSVDAIVEHAGVAKGSFYVHFKSKDALIAGFLTDYVTNLDFDYRSYYESISDELSACELLLSMVSKIIDIMINQVGYSAIRHSYEVLISKNVDADNLLVYNRDLYTILILIIDKGISQGEFKSLIPAEKLARHIVQTLRGYIYEWCIRYPNFDLKEETMEHFQLLLDGIK
jgi:AcrR family transcriptional regulator